jgi:hypothetical protein
MSEWFLKFVQVLHHKHCFVAANSLHKNITEATDTQSERVILLVFHSNNGYANATQCYCYTYLVYFLGI